jgi:tetratricopeptide (TPR) repeat protein
MPVLIKFLCEVIRRRDEETKRDFIIFLKRMEIKEKEGVSVTLLLLQRLRDFILSQLQSSSSTSTAVIEDKTWTTTKVCDELVKPWTSSVQNSFQYLMKEKHSITPHPHLNVIYSESYANCKPHYFISHAWKYQFVEVVESLEHYFEKHFPDKSNTEIYIWFDLFLNDQWNAPSLTFDWWSTTFFKAVGNIGHTLLILLPWENPIPLTRAWCLWEIHCTRATGSQLSIVLSSEQEKSFHETLRNNYLDIMKHLCKINVEKSEAFKIEDKENIFAAIRSTNGGFAAINRDISALIREWFRVTVKSLIDENNEITETTCQEDIIRILDDKRRYGNLLDDQGKVIEAIEWMQQVYDEQVRHIGEHHASTLKTLQTMSNIKCNLGLYDEAIILCERVIAGHLVTLSPTHPTLLQLYSNKAAMLKNRGEKDEALKILNETYELAIKDDTMGLHCSETMSLVFNIAMILSSNGQYDEQPPNFN